MNPRLTLCGIYRIPYVQVVALLLLLFEVFLKKCEFLSFSVKKTLIELFHSVPYSTGQQISFTYLFPK